MIPRPHPYQLFTGPLATATLLIAVGLCCPGVAPPYTLDTICLAAVVCSALFGGTGSGLASATVAVGGTALLLSRPGGWTGLGPDTAWRLVVLAVSASAVAVLVANLRCQKWRARAAERNSRGELATLRAALDQLTSGILILDQDLRGCFINRAFRSLWQLPDVVADQRPYADQLLRHGRDVGAYAVEQAELDRFLADRLEHLRRADPEPRDLRLSDGRIVRFHCSMLADGRRMACYTDVTQALHDSERLELLTTIDETTGLFNRRHFLYLGQREWDRFRRYDRPLSLVVFDIDGFDTPDTRLAGERFGNARDLVLKEVASRCQQALRTTDILACFGDEGFAALLPETPVLIAAETAERLRRRIAADPICCTPGKVMVTVSLGVAAAARSADGVVGMLKAADQALQEAKQRGRNRVEMQSRVT